MDWSKNYKPERKANWADISFQIRHTVSMWEVLKVYSPGTPTKGNRCPCPIHNGEDYNMSYTANSFKCFVCGAQGDVIEFVKLVCNLSTRSDAMKRMNADLKLYLPIDMVINEEMNLDLAKLRAEAEAKAKAKAEWQTKYHDLMDEWIRLDKVKRTSDPRTRRYAEAVKNIDRVSYELDCLPPEPR